MPTTPRFVLALVAGLCLPRLAVARCDAGALATARVAVAARCECDALSHAAYVRCATLVAQELVAGGRLPASCRGAVRKCAAASTCGRSGTVPCCRPRPSGQARCKVTTPQRCAATGGCAAPGPSCCDACESNGCATSTTASTTTTTTTASTTTTTTVPSSPCGNGVIDAGEACDGQPTCTPNCFIARRACCEAATTAGACSAAVPAVTLFANQQAVCGVPGVFTFMMGRIPSGTVACAPPPPGPAGTLGACVTPPPLAQPLSYCCQRSADVCEELVSTSLEALDQFHWNCAYEAYPAIPVVVGTCGGDGHCVPAS